VLASDLNLGMARLATDCTNVVRSIQSEGLRPYGAVMRDIQGRISSFIRWISFMRGCSNADAHVLAMSSVLLDDGRNMWYESSRQSL
jgi:hypothetical protein